MMPERNVSIKPVYPESSIRQEKVCQMCASTGKEIRFSGIIRSD